MKDAAPGFLTDKHVAIFGLGLMGASLASALKGKCRLLTGIDPNPRVVETALDLQMVNQAATHVGTLLNQVDLVILAAPVGSILNLLAKLPEICPGVPVVLDIGSTKVEICKAMQYLPKRFDPIGGHPMCGKESAGLENADPDIFTNAVFALVPLERTTQKARLTAQALATIIGSSPIWLDAESHDRQVAATSHLPYLAANALAYCTPLDTAALAASGFASTTRLAVTSPEMMLDVLQTNRNVILHSLQTYRDHLAVIQNALNENDFSKLQALLNQGSDARTNIMKANTGETL